MFSGMTGMLPMGMGTGMPGAGYGYGHWGSVVGGGGGPFPGYTGMPGAIDGAGIMPTSNPPNVLTPPVYDG